MSTIEERNQALQWAKNGATFMFVPNEKLIGCIIANTPEAEGINDTLKVVLLQKNPIRMEVETIIKYCLNTLDRSNSWVLDNGDIKVTPPQFETKIKENEDD